MTCQDYMSLRLIRLKEGEEFSPHPEGVTFVFVKGGAGKCVSRTGTQRILSGDMVVLNQSAGGKFTLFDKGEFLFWSFSVCFENMFPLFSGNEISRLHDLMDKYKAVKVYASNHPLAVECHRLLGLVPPQANLDYRGQLIRIAATIMSADFKEARIERAGYVRAEDHMIQVFDKLSASELINLSVSELADRFNCSRRHLNRLFHQHFGVAVAALRMEMRLLKAMTLLRDPEAKIINVAEQCGFNHLGLFNTCFKRRFGTSPGQWRKDAFKVADKTSSAKGSNEEKPPCPLHVNGLCPWNGKIDTNIQPSSVTDFPKEFGVVAEKAAASKLNKTSPNISLPLNPKRNASDNRARQ